MEPDVVFDLPLEHGRCVGIRIPEQDEASTTLARAHLLPEEVALARAMAPLRRRTWIGGRVALRIALARAGLVASGPLSSDERGAPRMPRDVAGSVSHKDTLGAALVRRAGDGTAIGVDVELDVPGKQDIASRVLAEDELAELAPLDPAARGREVLLRFSAKEAVYKALDPFVRRYVGFGEVSLVTSPDGTARVTPRLRLAEGPFAIESRWRRFDGLVLTTASVRRLVAARSLP